MSRPKWSGRFTGFDTRRETVDRNTDAIFRRWRDWNHAALEALPRDRRKFAEWEAEREARSLAERMSESNDGRFLPEIPASFMADSEARWQSWGKNQSDPRADGKWEARI